MSRQDVKHYIPDKFAYVKFIHTNQIDIQIEMMHYKVLSIVLSVLALSTHVTLVKAKLLFCCCFVPADDI